MTHIIDYYFTIFDLAGNAYFLFWNILPISNVFLLII